MFYRITEDGFLANEAGRVLDRDEAFEFATRVLDRYYRASIGEIEQANWHLKEKSMRRALRLSTPRPTPPPTPEKAGYVYLMQNQLLYKIGVSVDPERRRRQIEKASGLPTRLLAMVASNDPYALERSLHERFGDYREEGEWFDFDAGTHGEVLRFFEAMQEVER